MEVWDDTASTPPPVYGNVALENERPPPPPPPIIGVRYLAFPRNIGWHAHGQSPLTPNGDIRKLSDLTIHEITSILTNRLHLVDPNCIGKWRDKLRDQHLPFDKVFASMGTPLSDATEEKEWRKLVHRAIFTRNRKPNTEHKCRLCGNHEESQLLLFGCRASAPYWTACMAFTRTILKARNTPNIARAVILGLWTPTNLGLEDARAFLHHAFGCFYRDFAQVDLADKLFVRQDTFYKALLSFQSAALRRAHKVRLQYIHRTYSNLPKHVPQVELDRYPNIMTITPQGVMTLTPLLVTAIATASQAATAAKAAIGRRRN